MSKQKRILAVNDISCFGKCSLTVALPILSSCGFETTVLPTALLSTHTGGFTGYTFLDLTGEMKKIIDHWKNLKLRFDCIYSGYLGSEEQIKITYNIIKEFKIPLIFVDPVMADNGKLYDGFSSDFPQKMKTICKIADIITPNITEACLLTDTCYTEIHTKEWVLEIADKLSLICKKFVITGIKLEPDSVTTIVFDNGQTDFIKNENIDGMYHGTGDVFASSLLASILSGVDFKTSAENAILQVCDSIIKTRKLGKNITYGVDFEECTKNLIKRIEKSDTI